MGTVWGHKVGKLLEVMRPFVHVRYNHVRHIDGV